MPTPKPARIHRPLAATITAVLAVLALFLAPTPAHATTTAPVYKGIGWKAWTSAGIYSLSPQPYTIVFANTTARSKLAGYFKAPAAQVTSSVGVKITVTTTLDTTKEANCPAFHRIVVHYTYRPAGTAGMSRSHACYNTADRSAWGGHISMDSEYWTHTAWFSSNSTVNQTYIKDVSTHELGHIIGLDHPNTDVNHDGRVSSQECVRSAAGRKPIMCSPNRGPAATADGGKFTTEFDIPGLKQMLKNYWLRK